MISNPLNIILNLAIVLRRLSKVLRCFVPYLLPLNKKYNPYSKQVYLLDCERYGINESSQLNLGLLPLRNKVIP